MSTHSETVVNILSKLYRARSAMRSFWDDRYAGKIEEYQGYIKRKVECTMAIVKALQERHEDSGMSQALFFAAYVESVEPSK